MAKPRPGERCPGCSGGLRALRVPRVDENPHRGARWFKECEASLRLLPVQRDVPGRGLRTVGFKRRESTCSWQDPDLLDHRQKNREQRERADEKRRQARQRADAVRRSQGQGP